MFEPPGGRFILFFMVTQVSFCSEDVRRSFFSVIGQATVVLVVKVVKCHQ